MARTWEASNPVLGSKGLSNTVSVYFGDVNFIFGMGIGVCELFIHRCEVLESKRHYILE